MTDVEFGGWYTTAVHPHHEAVTSQHRGSGNFQSNLGNVTRV